SSLVVHQLGLSPIDPLRHGLFFERFLNPLRVEPPDIDLDVAYDRRDELLAWAHAHFGEQRAFAVSSLVRLGRRAAYTSALRRLGMSGASIARFLDELPSEELDVPPVRESLPEALRSQQAWIERLAGKPHHFAMHPSGLVLSDTAIDEGIPLRRSAKGQVMLEHDAAALAALGAPKLDLLGNRHLTQLATARLLGANVPDRTAARDPHTLSTLRRARTVGCFQIETPPMRILLPKLRIDHADDLVLALALVRPGPGAGTARSDLIARLHGEQAATPLHPSFDTATRDTHGVLVYEEQLLEVLAHVTGSSLAEADVLRAALVREGDAPELRARFLASATAHGCDASTAQRIWSVVATFAAYTFSRAHAASHARLAWQSAWLKTHCPLEHGCALLRHYGGAYPLRSIAAELVRSGVTVRVPSINASGLAHRIEQGEILLGLEAIRPLGAATRLALLDERARRGRFEDPRDLFQRVAMTERERAALVQCGACDELAPPPARPPSGAEPRSLERAALHAALVRARNELAVLGMHPSAHPMQLLRGEAERAGCVSSAEVTSFIGQSVRFAGIASATRRLLLDDGHVMQFVTLEDEHGLLDARLPPSVIRHLSNPVRHPGPYLLRGQLVSDHGSVQLH
ncbi:MAG TPA: hypothetical protein VHM19_01325, partial [Polyangiales bacterium]|nr:hypothetical protein [Polyangiales bacterium]